MIVGIDVYHNDELSRQSLLQMIKSHTIYFGFIKASTGANGKDSKFVEYWQTSGSSGLVCGGYHWFWPASNPSLQAENFIGQYKQVNNTGALPPVVDIEWTWPGGVNQTPSNELWEQVPPPKRISMIKEFLGKMEDELNVKPIIYTANSFWEELLLDHASPDDNSFFAGYPLWIADPNGNKKIPKPWQASGPTFTQTYFGGSKKSADPFYLLDQNEFNGTLVQFLNLTSAGYTLTQGLPFSWIVKDLQTALNTKRFLTDAPDGFFGTNTQKAVVAADTVKYVDVVKHVDVKPKLKKVAPKQVVKPDVKVEPKHKTEDRSNLEISNY